MLDLEVVSASSLDGTDIISVEGLKKRLRITHNSLDDVIEDCIIEAADKLHGPLSEIRRTIFPTTYRRYLTRFPDLKNDRGEVVCVGRGVIPMPFPPLVRVREIALEDGESPTTTVDPDDYVVKTSTIVPGEIHLKTAASWPDYTPGPRAISILFDAGYEDAFPATVKLFVALLAAHNFSNNSATINEPRQIMINRRVEFAVTDLRRTLAVPLDYSGWGED